MLPGDELKELFSSLGFVGKFGDCGGCKNTADTMNERGVAWCREFVTPLANEIEGNAVKHGWAELIRAFRWSSLLTAEGRRLAAGAACRNPLNGVISVAIIIACERSEQSGTAQPAAPAAKRTPAAVPAPAPKPDDNGAFIVPGSLEDHRRKRALGLVREVRREPQQNLYSNLIAEFEQAVTTSSTVELPHPQEPRGIVICSGGWRFFPSLYVTVRMIREVCDWPIQVRYFKTRNEFDPKMGELLSDFDVRWDSIESIGWTAPFRAGTPGGWQAKPLAILNSPFRQTIGLDSDCYPVADPVANMVNVPEVERAGAMYFPDIPSGPGNMAPEMFSALGMPFYDDRNWETGQMFVATERIEQRRALWLASWLAFRPDSNRYSYGDCGCFQMAYRRLNTSYWMQQGRPDWVGVAFQHVDPAARPLFVHRCRDKFRLAGYEKAFNTPQSSGDVQTVCERLPAEATAHRYYQELLGQLDATPANT